MVFLWAALYGLTYTLAERIAAFLSSATWPVPAAMLLYTLLLICWVFRSGHTRDVGLCIPSLLPPGKWLYLLPLFLLPAYNLLTADSFSTNLPAVFLTLSVCVTEEIFFRGFLLRYLAKRNMAVGLLLTNILFALFHLVNLTRGADPGYTLVQTVCAFAAGLCYSTATIQSGSLLPCMAAHFLTNITGSDASVPSALESAGLWLCIAAYLCWGILQSLSIRKFNKEIQS